MLSTGVARVWLRDSTLREGLDTPGVRFSDEQALSIACVLATCGVREVEVVAPSRVRDGLGFVRLLAREGIGLKSSGLIYAAGASAAEEIDAAGECLDRFDLLMPLSSKREPHEPHDKIAVLRQTLAHALAAPRRCEIGVGFPHATQADQAFLLEIASMAAREGAARVTVYDTNGGGDPFTVRALLERLVGSLPGEVPIFFHGHNDLGLATANSLAAVLGGAAGLDVTVNGLGDRAGNASLEQVVIALRLRGFDTGVEPAGLCQASRLVEELSGVKLSKLAPVVGEFVFAHRSPGHFAALTEFEAFAPELVGAERRTT